MLGLAKRSGSTVIGTDLVTKALPSGKIKLVIYASDSSDNTEKKITDKCKFYGVNCIKTDYYGEEIAHAIGSVGIVCVVGIANDGFSKELISLMSKETR